MDDEDSVHIHPVAFLHNASRQSAGSLFSRNWEEERHIFTGDSTDDAFVGTLRSWFAADGDHAVVGRSLLEAAFCQSPALLNAAAEILTRPETYPMTKQQGAIHSTVLHAVQETLLQNTDRSKAVIAIKGGPGTGKTWIAMHLLGSNARAHRQVRYATNSKSLRLALEKRARQGVQISDLPVGGLITSAATYWDKQKWHNPLDVLLVDEAHRVTKWTVRGTGQHNSEEVQRGLEQRNHTQLFELAKAAKVLVLFIDEDQAVRRKDACSLEDIREIADRVGASYQEFELTEQHRSGGSDAYEEWVDAS